MIQRSQVSACRLFLSSRTVAAEAGLGGLKVSCQAARADVDNDGDLDLMTKGKLFINKGNENHWLKIRLKGDGKTVNTAAIGA